MWTVSEALEFVKGSLKEKNIESYLLDSRLIVMEAVGLSQIQLVTKDDMVLSDKQLDMLKQLTERRGALEPMQYILGRCEFMGLDLEVNKDVLIPRADTEISVEAAMEILRDKNSFLDLCCGSGAIGISLLHYNSLLQGTLSDISGGAIAVARKNAEKNEVSGRAEFVESNLFEALKGKRFDAIISNPPYIQSDVLNELSPQVKDFEPRLALDGGSDGLDFYREIVRQAPEFLEKDGYLMFEIGFDQAKALFSLMEKDFCDIKLIKDLAGLDRVVLGKIKEDSYV